VHDYYAVFVSITKSFNVDPPGFHHSSGVSSQWYSMLEQFVLPLSLYALPLSGYSRTIPLRDQRIIKTHTAEGWRQSRRVHTGVLLAGASWRKFLHHRNDQSASLLFKGDNMVARFSAFSLRRSGAWTNCLPSLEK
jgi:hypothetical protein